MLDVYLIIDLIIIVALIVLSAAVLVQKAKSVTSITFAALAASVAVWIIANYISNDIGRSPETALKANYFVFFFSYFTAVNLLHFTISLVQDERARKIFKALYVPIFLVGLMSFTALVPAGVHLQDNVYAVEFGAGLPVYFVFLVSMIAAIFVVLKKNIKRSKGAQKTRLKTIYRSFAYSLPLLVLMLFILPVATGWFGLTNIGIVPMAAFVGGMYYAVFKHRLFDLRLVVVRSLAYVFTLGLILTIYALISFEASKYLFNGSGNENWRTLTNVILVIFAAVSYGPVKRTFNRVSDKLFYRDAYDAQTFLNDINKAVVANVDVEKLLRDSAGIINSYIKSTSVLFYLRSTEYSSPRMLGVDSRQLSIEDLMIVADTIADSSQKILVAEDLEEQSALRKLMRKYDIALISRLVTDYGIDTEGVGYLALGYKKSGNPYNKQDVDVIKIISGELVIAVQNGLRFEEIENFNVTLQQKVNDATKRLKKANDKLKAMDETKDEFISMASHQLRTPLTSVKGYVSMVLEGDAGPITDMQKKLLEQSFISSQRMVFLIADLLNLSRLKTGKFVIDALPTNLSDVIAGEVQQLRETAAGKNMTLTYNQPDSFPTLMLDETKIRQVIMNFVDNAIYYTPAGGKIDISLTENDKSVEFRVKDNGIGVPESEQHNLFNKFFRAKNAQKARPDGTGLGLFMAKKVIVAQGGALIFESKVGKGSTFGFSFAKDKLKVDEPAQA